MTGVGIYFFVSGERFAFRRWHAVPRKGDEVMLGPDGKKKPYKVVRVVWGVEGPEQLVDEGQQVNIDLKEIA